MNITRTLINRFDAKVRINEETGCHEWTGAKNEKGYGWFSLDGAVKKAHRVAWQLTHGPIPQGLYVLHACDNPSCVNVNHLFLGTHADNMLDMARKGRSRTTKLSLDDVYAIRSAVGTNRSIAEQYGVHYSLVSKIRSGKRWAHVV